MRPTASTTSRRAVVLASAMLLGLLGWGTAGILAGADPMAAPEPAEVGRESEADLVATAVSPVSGKRLGGSLRALSDLPAPKPFGWTAAAMGIVWLAVGLSQRRPAREPWSVGRGCRAPPPVLPA